MRRKRKEFVVRFFKIVDGEKVQIDPTKTDLPDRFKLALAEMTTGKKYELVDS